MAKSQPYTVACSGGLIKASNAIDLLKTPGVATDLRNFEVSIKGGYRNCLLYTSPSPRDLSSSRMPSSA